MTPPGVRLSVLATPSAAPVDQDSIGVSGKGSMFVGKPVDNSLPVRATPCGQPGQEGQVSSPVGETELV
ncbi:MAG: hypothetical protein ACLT2I_12660, partial [Corynebacterium variabile]